MAQKLPPQAENWLNNRDQKYCRSFEPAQAVKEAQDPFAVVVICSDSLGCPASGRPVLLRLPELPTWRGSYHPCLRTYPVMIILITSRQPLLMLLPGRAYTGKGCQCAQLPV
jgi:hypothetical protein